MMSKGKIQLGALNSGGNTQGEGAQLIRRWKWHMLITIKEMGYNNVKGFVFYVKNGKVLEV